MTGLETVRIESDTVNINYHSLHWNWHSGDLALDLPS